MSKLGLNHLSAYLPYALRCKVVDNGVESICELTGVYSDGTCSFHDLVESSHGFESVVPILRPMSELDENTRLDFFTNGGFAIERGGVICVFQGSVLPRCYELNNLPYLLMQSLLRQHFDVFGLIGAGLAIAKKDI